MATAQYVSPGGSASTGVGSPNAAEVVIATIEVLVRAPWA